LRRRVKFLLEWPLALLLLILSLPLQFVLAAMVVAGDGSPVLYREQRLGRGGRIFLLIKFRTLRQCGGRSIAPDDDARIFPVGLWLRRMRLDEIPQLLNVVMGDMSLVGPRPLSVDHAARIGEESLSRLLSVRPGITGAAALAFLADDAVMSGRGNAEAVYLQRLLPAKVALELDYLQHWGLMVDARLLGLTLLQVWSRSARRRSRQRVSRILAESGDS
jgi:lipopolysaccharide/colanic/teichoic acid biosynthesis glycosyltransferase